MTDAQRGDHATSPTRPVGERLRAAREAKGMSLSEVAARTRVPLRHLEALETSDFGSLPSKTYAVGFVRSYARVVDADEVALARDTRDEVARTGRSTPAYEPYEIADPTRVPSRGLTIVAAGVALALLILGALWASTSLFGGREEAGAPSVVAAVPTAKPSVAPAAATGQVRLVAKGEVWLRVYDAANKTLFLGVMKDGDGFDVPPDANDPMINVGRPDKLTVLLNGSALPPLGTGERAIKDVRVSAAALAARAPGQPAPAPSPSASGRADALPAAFAGSGVQRPRPRTTPRPRPSDLVVPSADRETARANRRSPDPEPTATATPQP